MATYSLHKDLDNIGNQDTSVLYLPRFSGCHCDYLKWGILAWQSGTFTVTAEFLDSSGNTVEKTLDTIALDADCSGYGEYYTSGLKLVQGKASGDAGIKNFKMLIFEEDASGQAVADLPALKVFW